MEDTSAMTAFLSLLAEIATAIWTQVGTICTTIIETPFLVFTVGFLFVGGCIGIVGRLISRR